MRSIRTSVRERKRLTAALMLAFVLAGGVAAVVYSNALTGNMNLVSQYSMELSWQNDEDPWQSSAFMDTPYTGTLDIHNLADYEQADIYLQVLVTTPTGGTTDMFSVKIGTDVLVFSGSSPDFEATTPYAMSTFLPDETKSVTFEFTFLSAGSPVLGEYVVTITAWKT